MESLKELRQRVRREQQLVARLRLATTRLADAQRERIWATVAGHQAGLSIRQIATAIGLSPSRVQQLLTVDEAQEISHASIGNMASPLPPRSAQALHRVIPAAPPPKPRGG